MLIANGIIWIVTGGCAVGMGSFELGQGKKGAAGSVWVGLISVAWGIINLCVS